MLPEQDEERPHISTADRLVRMANQIATFFHSQPAADGPQSVATHINKFWEPRMRRQFLDLAQQGAHGFDAMVVAAVPLITPPAPASKPGNAPPDLHG